MLFDTKFPDRAKIYPFYDFGRVAYKNVQQSTPKSATLQSVGAGIHCNIGRHFDLSADDAWQLNAPPGATNAGNLVNISVMLFC